MTAADRDREAFEAEARKDGLDVSSWDEDERMYDDSDTQWCWQGYAMALTYARAQAGEPRAAYERCPDCNGSGMLWTGEDVKPCPECKGNTVTPAPAQEPLAVPAGFKLAWVPDYPEGDVIGPCICGSWPGGKCLRCPVQNPPAAPASPPAESGEVERLRSVIEQFPAHDFETDAEYLRQIDQWWIKSAMPALASTPAPQPALEEDCQNCAGNGEIVTDWGRYLKAHPGDVGDEAVAECPECSGTGKVDAAPQPGGTPSAIKPLRDWIDPFERKWAAYRHANRELANYGVKQTIAWYFFSMGLCAAPQSGGTVKVKAADIERQAQMDRDIGILLATIDWISEATGEGPEGEDAAMVAQIRADHEARLASTPAPQPGGSWFTEDVRRASKRQAEIAAESPSARVVALQPCGYHIPEPAGGWRKEFAVAEKLKLRPIAETLAMLDGNAFFGDDTRLDWHEAYLPEASALYEANGGDAGWAGRASFAAPQPGGAVKAKAWREVVEDIIREWSRGSGAHAHKVGQLIETISALPLPTPPSPAGAPDAE